VCVCFKVKDCGKEPCCICGEDLANNDNTKEEESKEENINDQIDKNSKEQDNKQEEKECDDESKTIHENNKLSSILSDPTPIKLPGCGHLYHRNCISTWLRQKNTCPVCRSELETVPTLKSLEQLSLGSLKTKMLRWGLISPPPSSSSVSQSLVSQPMTKVTSENSKENNDKIKGNEKDKEEEGEGEEDIKGRDTNNGNKNDETSLIKVETNTREVENERELNLKAEVLYEENSKSTNENEMDPLHEGLRKHEEETQVKSSSYELNNEEDRLKLAKELYDYLSRTPEGEEVNKTTEEEEEDAEVVGGGLLSDMEEFTRMHQNNNVGSGGGGGLNVGDGGYLSRGLGLVGAHQEPTQRRTSRPSHYQNTTSALGQGAPNGHLDENLQRDGDDNFLNGRDEEDNDEEDNDDMYEGVVAAMARSMAIAMERSAAARRRAQLLRQTTNLPSSSSSSSSSSSASSSSSFLLNTSDMETRNRNNRNELHQLRHALNNARTNQPQAQSQSHPRIQTSRYAIETDNNASSTPPSFLPTSSLRPHSHGSSSHSPHSMMATSQATVQGGGMRSSSSDLSRMLEAQNAELERIRRQREAEQLIRSSSQRINGRGQDDALSQLAFPSSSSSSSSFSYQSHHHDHSIQTPPSLTSPLTPSLTSPLTSSHGSLPSSNMSSLTSPIRVGVGVNNNNTPPLMRGHMGRRVGGVLGSESDPSSGGGVSSTSSMTGSRPSHRMLMGSHNQHPPHGDGSMMGSSAPIPSSDRDMETFEAQVMQARQSRYDRQNLIRDSNTNSNNIHPIHSNRSLLYGSGSSSSSGGGMNQTSLIDPLMSPIISSSRRQHRSALGTELRSSSSSLQENGHIAYPQYSVSTNPSGTFTILPSQDNTQSNHLLPYSE